METQYSVVSPYISAFSRRVRLMRAHVVSTHTPPPFQNPTVVRRHSPDFGEVDSLSAVSRYITAWVTGVPPHMWSPPYNALQNLDQTAPLSSSLMGVGHKTDGWMGGVVVVVVAV